MNSKFAASMTFHILILSTFLTIFSVQAEEIDFKLRKQTLISGEKDLYQRNFTHESWKPSETAVIVCDVWDSHHGYYAVKRVNELAPRINDFVKAMRDQGVFIIHAPSDCMKHYQDHPARKRAMSAPTVELPKGIKNWCTKIPVEENAVYPIDQSDGGEDETAEESAAWDQELIKQKRNPKTPWLKQHDAIEIDAKQDAITDRGDDVWRLFAERGIKNVILVGVHTNMCVLGRPFGLRRMVENKKNVVLARDLTDTMYNPNAKPYVNHFSGTDLIIDYIERYICPTISSEQVLAKTKAAPENYHVPFRFKHDDRKHSVLLMAEREYETKNTLTKYADQVLRKDFKVTCLYEDPADRNHIVGIEAVKNADLLIISVRRRTLFKKDLQLIRDFVAAGKPMVGIRTASHPFSVKGKPIPDDRDVWDQLDRDVWSGNYQGHFGRKELALAKIHEGAENHPVVQGIEKENIKTHGSLYKNNPLPEAAQVLLTAKADSTDAHPVAWIYQRKDGGKSFYTSLGHVGDFADPMLPRLLTNAIYWSLEMEPSKAVLTRLKKD